MMLYPQKTGGKHWMFSTKIKIFNKIESRGILDRLYLFTSYLFYNKILKTIDRFDFEILVVFADMQPVDNILVQFYKGRKITTVTLQHGLFVDYEGTYNISSVSYKNVVSDHFLAWGESNKMLIEKHNPDCNVIVCGNPIIKKSYNCVNVRRKFFTIVLDWDVFEKENTEMIGMAMRLADMIRMDFQVRYHPSNDKSKYIINSTFLMQNETLDYMCSEFILGHTSSLIHVAQRLGKKVFKYNTTVPTNPIDKECVVNNESDIPWTILATEFPVVGATNSASNFPSCKEPTTKGVFASCSTLTLCTMVGSASHNLYILSTLTAACDKIAVIFILPFSFNFFIISKVSGNRSPAPASPQASLTRVGVSDSFFCSVEFMLFSLFSVFSHSR